MRKEILKIGMVIIPTKAKSKEEKRSFHFKTYAIIYKVEPKDFEKYSEREQGRFSVTLQSENMANRNAQHKKHSKISNIVKYNLKYLGFYFNIF